jgi:hydroxymethylbilane synthase
MRGFRAEREQENAGYQEGKRGNPVRIGGAQDREPVTLSGALVRQVMIGQTIVIIQNPARSGREPATPVQRPARVVIGTRGSALAMWQANVVRNALAARFPQTSIDLHVIRPEGDVDKTSSLLKIGGRGVFASALQQALLDGEIDIAVHSTKDVPTIEPAGLVIAAFPEREDARDAVVSRHGVGLAGLPPSPVIGTSSRRRAVQVQAIRPDATVIDLRGNIDTRLRKAASPDYDAIILAAAGLTRMGWQNRISEYLAFDRFVPSPGQGALAIETRADPDPACALSRDLDDPNVSFAVRLEREFLRAMGGGCTTPIGAHAVVEGSSVTLWAMMAAEDGSSMRQETLKLERATALDDVVDVASDLMKAIGQDRDRSGLRRTGTQGSRPPLAGKTVLVTGTSRFAAALEAAYVPAGAHVLVAPTLDIQPSSTPEALHAALVRAASGEFEWLVVTSGQTVPALAAFGAGSLSGQVRIASVGTSTTRALDAAGLTVSLTPADQTGPGLVEAFADAGISSGSVLCLLGSTASTIVPDGLAAAGMAVTRVESYRSIPVGSIPDEVRAAVHAGRVDLVVFASPLTVNTLSARLGADLAALSGACLVAMGATTRHAMEQANLPVHVVAETPTPDGIVDASRTYFAERSGIEADH